MASDWSAGYVTEIDYTQSYFADLSPIHLHFCLASAGIRPPAIDDDYAMLELGCGQGLNTAISAATNPGTYWGVDFMPSQINNARELTDGRVDNARFFEMSFEEFLDADLDQRFDFIVLHGIYSWISRDMQEQVVAVARKYLKTNGFVYVSYNCAVAWSEIHPLRQIMAAITEMSGKGPVLAKVDEAIEVLSAASENGALYFRAHPGAKRRLEQIADKNRQYVAHEYLNGSWQPLFHSEVARDFSGAKLAYATSAELMRNIPEWNVKDEMKPLMERFFGTLAVEDFKDILTNTSFRRDIFTKARPRMGRAEIAALLSDFALYRLKPLESEVPIAKVPLGEMALSSAIYRRIDACFDKADKPILTISELANAILAEPMRIMASVIKLVSTGYLRIVPATAASEAATSSLALNSALADRALTSRVAGYIAVPALGGGHPLKPLEQLFLNAVLSGDSDPVPVITDRLVEAGKTVNVGGKARGDAESIWDSLTKEFEEFRSFGDKLLLLLKGRV